MSLSILAVAVLQATTLADPASAETAAVLVPVNAVFSALAARDARSSRPIWTRRRG